MQKHASLTIFAPIFTILSLLALPLPALADTINVMWDPNSESQVAGYIVHVGTQPGVHSQHVDVGLATAWLYASAVAGQQYCFTVSAYFAGPIEGPRSSEVCGFSNAPPALVNPGSQTSTIAQADSLQLAGSDPMGDPLTYSATGLPPGLTLMASTGYISGTPTTSGTYSVTARATDGVLTASQTFTWTVSVADTTPPVVNITSPTSAATYENSATTLALSGTASDATGVAQVTWVSNRGESGTASGTASWAVPAITLQAGSNVLTVTARDAAGNTSTDTLTVTYNTGDTTVPVVTISNPTSASTLATARATVNLAGTASDNVGVTRVIWSNDRGGSGTATGTTSWSANGVALQAGVNVLTVTASDAAGNRKTDVLTVTSTDPLRITSLTADRPAPQPVGTTVTFTAVAAGGGGSYEYRWDVYNGSKWVTKTNWSSNNLFVWTPTTARSAAKVRAVVRVVGTPGTAMATMAFPIVP